MTSRTKVLLFFACDLLFNMAASFAHPVTPSLFSSLGLAQYMFGMALAAMLTVNFLVSPFWGKINDFIPGKTIMLVSCLGYALGQMFFGLARTEYQFIAARAFTGIFTSGAFVSILTYIVNTSPDYRLRGSYLTLHATIQSVGGAFGYFVGGMLGEITPHTAIITQVVTLALCGLFFFIICDKDNMYNLSEVPLRRLVEESNPFAAFLAGKEFLRGALASVFVLTVLHSLGSSSFDQSFNYYLKDVYNYSSSYNGTIKGATGLLTLAINSTLVLWLIRNGNFKKSLAAIFIVCGATMIASLLTPDPLGFIVGNTIVQVLIFCALPLIQNMVTQYTNASKRNLTMGFYNSMKSLGSIFGAMASGILYTFDPKMPFIFGIVVCVIAVGVALFTGSSTDAHLQEDNF